MINPFSNIINQAKDKGVSRLFEHWLSQQLEPYGRLLGMTLDSKNKAIRMEVLLHGESESISITIDNYSLVDQGDQTFLIAKKMTASRAWIGKVLDNFLIDRKLELPRQYAGMIKMVL